MDCESCRYTKIEFFGVYIESVQFYENVSGSRFMPVRLPFLSSVLSLKRPKLMAPASVSRDLGITSPTHLI